MQIQRLLNDGEELLWVGSPKSGIIFRDRDLILIPASVIIFGFACFVDWLVLNYQVTIVLIVIAILISLAALQLLLLRFIVDASKRRNTFFAITNLRIIKQFGIFKKEFRTLPFNNIGKMELLEEKNNFGYISFGNNNSLFTWLFGNFRSTENTIPGLELIENPEQVYQLILKLKANNQQEEQ